MKKADSGVRKMDIKKFLLLVMALLVISMAAYSYFTISNFMKENDCLKNQLREAEKEIAFATQNKEHTGGVETQVVAPKNENIEFLFPISAEDYFISSPYGVRISPFLNVTRKHEGVDIGAVLRSQIVAVKDGTITTHYPPPDGYFRGHDIYGGYVVIQHDNGFITRYAHLSRTYVSEGQRVQQGEVIGRMGKTGLATGAHLHFEMEINGKTVNPLLYITNPKE